MSDLKAALYKTKPKLYPSRQRLTLPAEEGQKKPIVLQDGKKLSDYAITSATRVTFKDLGTQVVQGQATSSLYCTPVQSIFHQLETQEIALYSMTGFP